MIQTSQEYKDLMLSNVRPKCEPKITVEGTDNLGNEIQLIWNAQNISSLNYKRGIDPLGRELPYMTLEWTELYHGKLNPQNYPEKYANITKYMRVTLEFEQSLSFERKKWRDLLSTLWGSLRNRKWGEVSREQSTETIRLPYLFLSATPTVEGNTIKWTAVDLLSLLDETLIKSFDGATNNIPIQNPIIYMLVNARGTYQGAKYVFNALTSTINYMSALPQNFWRWSNLYGGVLPSQVIFDGTVKDNIKNYLAAFSYYLDFADDLIIIREANWTLTPTINWELPSTILYDFPLLTPYPNVALYNFRNYNAVVKGQDSSFVLSPPDAQIINMYGQDFLLYSYGRYGIATRSNGGQIEVQEINRAIIPGNSDSIIVYPIDNEGVDNILSASTIGEAFVEDNPVNPFDKHSVWAEFRFELLKRYFNGKYALDISTVGNPALETGDIITVSTNLYDGDSQIQKNALVIETGLTYNGALKETIKAHEVEVQTI